MRRGKREEKIGAVEEEEGGGARSKAAGENHKPDDKCNEEFATKKNRELDANPLIRTKNTKEWKKERRKKEDPDDEHHDEQEGRQRRQVRRRCDGENCKDDEDEDEDEDGDDGDKFIGQFDINYIIFRNVEKFKNYFVPKSKDIVKENNEYLGIFHLMKWKISNLINYLMDMCWNGQGTTTELCLDSL